MKIAKFIILAFLLSISILACTREEQTVLPSDGTGDLKITIGLSSTKAETVDVDIINNLHIFIADNADQVIRYANVSDINTNSGTGGTIEISADQKTATAKFTNLERGNYTLWIIANLPTGALTSYCAEGVTLNDYFKNYSFKVDANYRPDFKTEILSDGSTKAVTPTGMPMSIIQNVSIGAGVNKVSAELLRMCGRVRVIIRNNTTDKDIFIQSISLGDKNPSMGYLFHKADHSAPSGNVYGHFNSINLAKDEVSMDVVTPGNEVVFLDQYVFESGINAFDGLNLSFNGALFPSGTTSAVVDNVSYDVYTPGTEFQAFNRNNVESGTGLYLMRNSAANYFLFSDGTYVREKFHNSVAELLASTEFQLYLWSFGVSSFGSPGSSVNYIKNEGVGKYLNISTSAVGNVTVSDSQTSLIVGTQPYGMLIRNGSYNMFGSKIDNNILYTYNNSAGAPSDSKFYWYFTPVIKETKQDLFFAGAEKVFTKQVSQINYINEYGISEPIKSLCRNQELNIVINIHYSPESAILSYEVDSWTKVENETTFD